MIDQITLAAGNTYTNRNITEGRTADEAEKMQTGGLSVNSAAAVTESGEKTNKKMEVSYSKTDITSYEDEGVPESDGEEKEKEEVRNISEEVYEELSLEGDGFKEYVLNRLVRAIERVLEGRAKRQEITENQVEKQAKIREEVEKMSLPSKNAANGLTEYLVRIFAAADIPVTEEKVEEVKEVIQSAGQITELSGGAKVYLIRSNMEATVQNLYRAVFSGEREQKGMLSDTTWEELTSAAQDVLWQAGLTADESQMADARWLVEQNLPLTAENVVYKEELDAISFPLTDGQLEDALARSLKENEPANQAKLTDSKKERRDKLAVSAFARKVEQKLNEQEGLRAEDVTIRRQLLEIQLRLTSENGVKLLQKGISLDLSSLEDIVEGLKYLEASYYEKMYCEADGVLAESDAENVALLARTDTAVKNIKEAPAVFLGVTFATRRTETLEAMSVTAGRVKAEFADYEHTMESVMTKPRADMGDSMQKAFANMGERLDEMGLEKTESNQRAVRILAYNHMELTAKNVEEMKYYDARVQSVLGKMTPQTMVDMIKNRQNPLSMTLDELEMTIDAIKKHDGQSEQKYSEFLVKLDQKKELSQEERDSYIGICRLLYQVEKSDGAAIGYLVNSGREITLSNLLSAVRTGKKGMVDAAIDDASEQTVRSTDNRTDIRAQAETAFTYGKEMVQRLADELTPGQLQRVAQEYPDYSEMSLERLSEECSARDDLKENTEFLRAEMEQLKNTILDTEASEFLRSLSLEESISSLEAAQEFLRGESTEKKLRSIAEQYGVSGKMKKTDTDALRNAEIMQTQVEEWQESADNIIEELFESANLTAQDSVALLRLRNVIRLTGTLSKQEYYEIPMEGEDGFVKMNLTIRHEENVSGEIRMEMKQKEGEAVTIQMTVEQKNISVRMSSDSREALDSAAARKDKIIETLFNNGFSVTAWENAGKGTDRFAASTKQPAENANLAREQNKARTDDLYLAAKLVVSSF